MLNHAVSMVLYQLIWYAKLLNHLEYAVVWLRVSRILNLYLDKYMLRKRSFWPIWNIDNKEMNIIKTLSLDPLNVKVTLATLFVNKPI